MSKDYARSASNLPLFSTTGLFHSLYLTLNTPHAITGSYLFVQLYSLFRIRLPTRPAKTGWSYATTSIYTAADVENEE
ncbi:unnamed protein product [Macrosiphum euphorbiae]|uniref:Uncharacterized protein n=1 Tax=Macrosiphum euphorbiae TaxID=13131 RepID=A0AAV0VRA0_9HEMI|nr:unnamed protein product [Macrosiphum euphorbiae]